MLSSGRAFLEEGLLESGRRLGDDGTDATRWPSSEPAHNTSHRKRSLLLPGLVRNPFIRELRMGEPRHLTAEEI